MQQALDWETPVGQVCLNTLFDLIPEEWLLKDVEDWPKSFPDSWEMSLKASLLSDPSVEDKALFLDESTLTTLVVHTIDRIGVALKECDPTCRPFLAYRAPFDLDLLIRKNLRRNPLLETSEFVAALFPLTLTLNRTHTTKEALTARVDFLKKLSFAYKRDEELLSLDCAADKLPLILLQLFKKNGPLSEEEEIFFDKILTACSDERALSILKEIEEGEGKVRIPKDMEPLNWVLKRINTYSEVLGAETILPLFRELKEAVREFQHDSRHPATSECLKDLLMKGADLVYAFPSCFDQMEIYTLTVEILNALPPLTPSADAIHHLQEMLFEGKEEELSRILATKLYANWWYKKKLLPPLDSLIEWEMHTLLVTQGCWELECQDAVQRVKTKIRETHPQLPFNAPHAESLYHSLRHAHRESK